MHTQPQKDSNMLLLSTILFIGLLIGLLVKFKLYDWLVFVGGLIIAGSVLTLIMFLLG